MGIQNCAVFHGAPGMLPPNPIRTEVVADRDRVALALQPKQGRVPVTLVGAAARDPDFDVREWLTCFGDQLNIGVIDKIHIHPADAKQLPSQSGARNSRHSPSLPYKRARRRFVSANITR